jgi:hypothetical protein
MVSILIASRKYDTSYREITPTVYDFVNDCNHGYTFCMAFYSWMRPTLPRTVLSNQGIHTHGNTKIHMR